MNITSVLLNAEFGLLAATIFAGFLVGRPLFRIMHSSPQKANKRNAPPRGRGKTDRGELLHELFALERNARKTYYDYLDRNAKYF